MGEKRREDGKITQINKSRIILKTFKTPGNVIGLAFDVHQELVLIVVWSDPVIYKIVCDRILALFNLHCRIPSGRWLACVQWIENEVKLSDTQYSGITNTQIIENSNQGKSLLSVDDKSLLQLT